MPQRVLSGMRPTGGLHLGHLCGVLNNWLAMQERSECYFFVADWHALTTEYQSPPDIAAYSKETIVTWLAVGIDPQKATIFIQSQVPEHAELHVLLSMLCPLPKLLQMPTYKDQQDNLQQNLNTYGFLGYPLLQSADILAYRADAVPVGEDQQPHIEFTREIARRVNHFYGKSDAFRREVKTLIANLPPEARKTVKHGAQAYRQDGNETALADALAAIDAHAPEAKQRAALRGYCLYEAMEILPAPEAILEKGAAALPGTDGRKMSKSYDNAINLFDEPAAVDKKIARMMTDPARQKREDKGDPEKCPVWRLHQQFSDEETRQWAADGCRSAGIGCLDCKKRVSGAVNDILAPIQTRRREMEKDSTVDDIIADGCRRARATAGETLAMLRQAMRLVT